MILRVSRRREAIVQPAQAFSRSEFPKTPARFYQVLFCRIPPHRLLPKASNGHFCESKFRLMSLTTTIDRTRQFDFPKPYFASHTTRFHDTVIAIASRLFIKITSKILITVLPDRPFLPTFAPLFVWNLSPSASCAQSQLLFIQLPLISNPSPSATTHLSTPRDCPPRPISHPTTTVPTQTSIL